MISDHPDLLLRYHESAHALIVLAEDCELVEVKAQPVDGHAACVTYDPEIPPDTEVECPLIEEQLRRQIRIWSAGTIAEHRLCAEQELDVPPLWGGTDQDRIERALASITSDPARQREILASEQETTRQMVDSRWTEIAAVAQNLQAVRSMTGQEVETFLTENRPDEGS